jgi:hypothetical protein
MDISKGVSFTSIAEAKAAIIDYCTKYHKCYKVSVSNKVYYCVVCKDHSCPFTISCYKNKEEIVNVTKCQLNHSCNKYSAENHSVRSAYVTNKISDSISYDPKIKVKPIVLSCQGDDGVKVPYLTAWRGRKKAIEDHFGSEESKFGKIQSYLDKINHFNDDLSGAWAVLETDDDNGTSRFKRCFIEHECCFYALPSCHRMIQLDACHIRSKYGGVILAACSIDGEGSIVPIAFGIVSVENLDNWGWFIDSMKFCNHIISDTTFTIISDRAKGLQEAVHEILPHCPHLFCVHHIKNNIKERFKYTKTIATHLWKAAETYDHKEFLRSMQAIKNDSRL